MATSGALRFSRYVLYGHKTPHVMHREGFVTLGAAIKTARRLATAHGGPFKIYDQDANRVVYTAPRAK